MAINRLRPFFHVGDATEFVLYLIAGVHDRVQGGAGGESGVRHLQSAHSEGQQETFGRGQGQHLLQHLLLTPRLFLQSLQLKARS